MAICIPKLSRALAKHVAVAALSLGFFFATAIRSAAGESEARKALNNLEDLKHIIIIYQENWSFDGLYGRFPGANGFANSFDTLLQLDKTAAPPYSQPIFHMPVPLKGSPPAIDSNFPSVGGKLTLASNHSIVLPLIPYDLTNYISAENFTGDLVHRFYHEQLQIDNGALEPKIGDLDKFVTWSDNPGLVLSYINATDLPEGRLAQQ